MEIQQQNNQESKVGLRDRIKVVFTNLDAFLGPDIKDEEEVEYKEQQEYLELNSELKKELDAATKIVTSSEFNAATIARDEKKKAKSNQFENSQTNKQYNANTSRTHRNHIDKENDRI